MHNSVDGPAFIPFPAFDHFSTHSITACTNISLLVRLFNHSCAPPRRPHFQTLSQINRSDPFPDSTPLPGPFAFAISSPNIRVLLHDRLDPQPNPLPLCLAKCAPQDIIAQLTDTDEALAESAVRGQGSLSGETVERRADKAGDLGTGGLVGGKFVTGVDDAEEDTG